MTTTDRNISVHRVGLLWALNVDWRALTLHHDGPRLPGYTWRALRSIARLLLARRWRAARNQLAGWHAEHAYAGRRVGHGWTRNRALADLRRHLDAEEASQP